MGNDRDSQTLLKLKSQNYLRKIGTRKIIFYQLPGVAGHKGTCSLPFQALHPTSSIPCGLGDTEDFPSISQTKAFTGEGEVFMPPPSCSPPCISDIHELYDTDLITEIMLYFLQFFPSHSLCLRLFLFPASHVSSQSNPIFTSSSLYNKSWMTTNLLVDITILDTLLHVQECFYQSLLNTFFSL